MNGIKLQYLNGLGLVAKSKRVIKPGSNYNPYFPAPEKTNPIIHDDGSVMDTVDYCKKIVRSTLNDTKKIAPLFAPLKNSPREATCAAIFKFVYDHIQYEEDKPNVEQLRRPARTWADRKGDCDCMSIFISSILTNLQIPHHFRIVKMYGRNWFQHIYVIVPREGKTNMNIRDNYIVIDPVLDKFNQEAPKINHKKDFNMGNLAGIPIQYLNGVNGDLKFGEEFNGLEGFNGTEEQLQGEWNRRMKTHLVNTHAYITKNPKRVSAFYNVPALASAYKELIGVWDSEHAREGTLDRLSSIEESFLHPHLQGLGDILGGDDDRLFGLINADLNGLGSLGKSKKQAARKAAKAAHKPVKKRGHFTKIKQASKKVKALKSKVDNKVIAAGKKAGAKAKEIAKKVGKLAVKGATWPIIAGTIMAMKVNAFKIGSRLYWGLFPKDEAMQHGILPDYWEAANKSYKYLLDIFTKKLMGSEAALRKSIITGRAAKVAKRGTHGLGSIGNGLMELQGYSGLGFPPAVAAALITAGVTVLLPVTKSLASNMNGKKKTANSEPESIDENVDPNTNTDTGESETMTESEAAHIEDNYNNEVVETPPVQEPEADGTVAPEETPESVEGIGEREYDAQLGDLGRKIKSKPGTETHKRVKKDKISRKQKKLAKKAAKPQTVKVSSSKSSKAQKHIADAQALQKMPKHKLIEKIKAGISRIKGKHKLKNLTAAQISDAADKIINKSPEEIIDEAKKIATGDNTVPDDATYSDSQGNQYPNKAAYEAALSAKGITPEEDITKGGGPNSPEGDSGKKDMSKPAPEEGMSTGKKIGIAAALALGVLAIAKSSKKKEPAVSGLSGPSKHSKKELVEEGKKIQKKLAKMGEKLPHGYNVANRKKKVIRIK